MNAYFWKVRFWNDFNRDGKMRKQSYFSESEALSYYCNQKPEKCHPEPEKRHPELVEGYISMLQRGFMLRQAQHDKWSGMKGRENKFLLKRNSYHGQNWKLFYFQVAQQLSSLTSLLKVMAANLMPSDRAANPCVRKIGGSPRLLRPGRPFVRCWAWCFLF